MYVLDFILPRMLNVHKHTAQVYLIGKVHAVYVTN